MTQQDTADTLLTAGAGAGGIEIAQASLPSGGVGDYLQLAIGVFTILKMLKPSFVFVKSLFKKKKKGDYVK